MAGQLVVAETQPAEEEQVAELPPVGDVVLSARDLVKDFQVTKGAVLQRKVGQVSAVAGVSFDIR